MSPRGSPRRAISRLRGPTKDQELERRLVWIFGSPRSGSTWLLNLLRSHPGVLAINEPSIGLHLGVFASDVIDAPAATFDPERLLFSAQLADTPDYFFSSAHADTWRPLLRALILGRVRAQVEALPNRAAAERAVLLKEPHGSQAADLIMSVVPHARLIFLVRDGRDSVDSELDASETGTWATAKFGGGRGMSGAQRLAFVEQRAHKWLCRIEGSQRAYRALPDEQRVMVRYEELLTDTVRVVSGVLSRLGVEASPGAVRSVVERLSVNALPEERKGPGRFVRAATPGAWRDNLSEEEQAKLQAIIGPKLAELGYD